MKKGDEKNKSEIEIKPPQNAVQRNTTNPSSVETNENPTSETE